MLLTGAEILVNSLIDNGVDTVFGYPGGAVLNIYDALFKKSDKIRHILTCHEQGAAHAADGYARSTGKVGVCIATSGPGATNLVTGIATAYMDSTPMVAITGNVTRPLLGKDSFQEVDITGITMPITKHNYIVKDIKELQGVDVAILCTPTRSVEKYAKEILAMGINTVDSFDIHTGIVDLRRELGACAKEHGAVSIISAGWDPGSDSIVRTMLEAIAPKGITYTNFGPGMSMGHTVAVKAIDGVKAALSMTIPTGTGIHRRMVYIELKDGYKFEDVAAAIKSDAYFVNDETHVKQVPSVDALLDMGHGVNLTRKGVSGKTQNQLFEFNMRINNPALTAQVLVCVARASMKQQPGCYTMVEVPVIDLLPGDREEWIGHLV